MWTEVDAHYVPCKRLGWEKYQKSPKSPIQIDPVNGINDQLVGSLIYRYVYTSGSIFPKILCKSI